ncbi:hypothetical protein ANCDUO_11123 [Ancylostoma duodenale]|uniref:Sodium:neurotransmitter symporter family protein n=1 Tax=Ancylostoma duodenale TaxID=51022 RepID=A0A0C2D911_9BILA|nr:hypothetical protein ANCDUO_11123 [Ancylostoma duodenale]
MESLLATISVTVGLGSLWRFPTLAYNNGGSAFLLPYLVCMLLFGLPMLYLEMVMGQCSNYGPTKLYALCIPALEGELHLFQRSPIHSNYDCNSTGLGWAMTIISLTVSVYYCVIVAWSFLYLFNSIVGGSSLWGKCNNKWNDICT